jgi:hypothetical protein
MQKKEEEMKKLNKTLLDETETLDLDPHANNNNVNSTVTSTNGEAEEKFSKMDLETAKELDDAVRIRLSSTVGNDVTLLELPPLYKVLLDDDSKQATDLPNLSKSTHYDERIGRDMRHLAVSIASCVDGVEDWVDVCNEFQPTGGLLPLVESIQEGATSIRKRRDDAEISDLVESRYEESFMAASSACRALRDLCALDLDLAAVVTDGLLRANTAYAKKGKSLLNDLVTLLNHAQDNTEIAHTTNRRGLFRRKKTRTRNPRRSRKGKQHYSLQKNGIRCRYPLIISIFIQL